MGLAADGGRLAGSGGDSGGCFILGESLALTSVGASDDSVLGRCTPPWRHRCRASTISLSLQSLGSLGENPASSLTKPATAAALSFPPWGHRLGVFVHAYVLPMLVCLATVGAVDFSRWRP
jgi:hypothetical protein